MSEWVTSLSEGDPDGVQPRHGLSKTLDCAEQFGKIPGKSREIRGEFSYTHGIQCVPSTDQNCICCLVSQGKDDEAKILSHRAKAITETLLGKDDSQNAMNLKALADLFETQMKKVYYIGCTSVLAGDRLLGEPFLRSTTSA